MFSKIETILTEIKCLFAFFHRTIKNKEKLGKKVCENLSQEQQNGVSPQKIRKRKMKTKIKDKEILYSRESVKSFNQGKKGYYVFLFLVSKLFQCKLIPS